MYALDLGDLVAALNELFNSSILDTAIEDRPQPYALIASIFNLTFAIVLNKA